MNPLEKMKARARELREKRGLASRDYDSEDFNGCLLIDGVTGSFGFEMHKCDRDFIAHSANTALQIAEDVERLLKAIEKLKQRRNEILKNRVNAETLIAMHEAEITAILNGEGK